MLDLLPLDLNEFENCFENKLFDTDYFGPSLDSVIRGIISHAIGRSSRNNKAWSDRLWQEAINADLREFNKFRIYDYVTHDIGRVATRCFVEPKTDYCHYHAWLEFFGPPKNQYLHLPADVYWQVLEKHKPDLLPRNLRGNRYRKEIEEVVIKTLKPYLGSPLTKQISAQMLGDLRNKLQLELGLTQIDFEARSDKDFSISAVVDNQVIRTNFQIG